jgi:hypothetical protein
MTVSDLARVLSRYFVPIRDGQTIGLRDDAPQWAIDVVRKAHGDMMPDDWRYHVIRAACEYLTEDRDDDDHEFADGQVDVYTSDRTAWLASSLDRVAYVVDAAADFGAKADPIDAIAQGQYAEASEILSLTRSALGDVVDAFSANAACVLVDGGIRGLDDADRRAAEIVAHYRPDVTIDPEGDGRDVCEALQPFCDADHVVEWQDGDLVVAELDGDA